MDSNPLYSENYFKFIGVEAKGIRALLFDRKDGQIGFYWVELLGNVYKLEGGVYKGHGSNHCDEGDTSYLR